MAVNLSAKAAALLEQMVADDDPHAIPTITVQFSDYGETAYQNQYGWEGLQWYDIPGEGRRLVVVPDAKVRIDHAGPGHTPGLAKIPDTEKNREKVAILSRTFSKPIMRTVVNADGTQSQVQVGTQTLPPKLRVLTMELIAEKAKRLRSLISDEPEEETPEQAEVKRGRGRPRKDGTPAQPRQMQDDENEDDAELLPPKG